MSEPTVLIIDDDPAVQSAIAEDLRREGYDLQFAENGQHGLRLAQEIAPTVIILDLRMPIMDGFEFLTAIDLKPADPYSVNIGCVVIEQQVYIDPADDRTWYQHIKADANVRLRFDGTETVYLAKATRVEDETILAQFDADRIVLRLEPRS